MNLKKSFLIFFVLSALLLGYSELCGSNKNPVKKSIININQASAAQLQTLPKIGKKVAQRILDYRKKHGKFKRVEDLMKVKGIGEKTFNNLKARITVGSVQK